jgi:CBS domain-containing protein
MRVADIMTTKIVAVRQDAPVKSIAPLLFAHGISAVPVLNEDGFPMGMISEGDLMPRDASEREQAGTGGCACYLKVKN